MLRFKQFSGNGAELETTVNSWLAEFEPDVTQMAQTTREDGAIVMSFLFQESFRGQKLRLSSEAKSEKATHQPSRAMPDKPLKVNDEPA
jgi:hypothetical protein